MENTKISSLKSKEIVDLLQEATNDRRPLKHKLQREAPVRELVEALRITNVELTRCILCDILAARRAKTAIRVLIDCLDDPSLRVKDAAAEALGKIGSQKAGEALLEHFIKTPTLGFAVALGAIKHHSAIPYLIEALYNLSGNVRGGAAWSLGNLKVVEAIGVLENALAVEHKPYAINRMKEALDEIRENLE